MDDVMMVIGGKKSPGVKVSEDGCRRDACGYRGEIDVGLLAIQ